MIYWNLNGNKWACRFTGIHIQHLRVCCAHTWNLYTQRHTHTLCISPHITIWRRCRLCCTERIYVYKTAAIISFSIHSDFDYNIRIIKREKYLCVSRSRSLSAIHICVYVLTKRVNRPKIDDEWRKATITTAN